MLQIPRRVDAPGTVQFCRASWDQVPLLRPQAAASAGAGPSADVRPAGRHNARGQTGWNRRWGDGRQGGARMRGAVPYNTGGSLWIGGDRSVTVLRSRTRDAQRAAHRHRFVTWRLRYHCLRGINVLRNDLQTLASSSCRCRRLARACARKSSPRQISPNGCQWKTIIDQTAPVLTGQTRSDITHAYDIT
jgi:hypothetical protein